MSTNPNHPHLPGRLLTALCAGLLLIAACGTSDPRVAADTHDTVAAESTQSDDGTGEVAPATDAVASGDCEVIAALFVTGESANPDLDDPEVEATCEGDNLLVTSNGIPDYTYIETSPGLPRNQDNLFTIPATPTVADTPTDAARLGTVAVTLTGIQIFGPTEGTGGDVESLPGILSDCGSHNGPSGFHIHLILTPPETDCLFSREEVAEGPQLVGYAFDGFPIYTGTDQYTSSWELTDESLFATDTWAAHSYVEGSGDLDECNGRYDDDGNYAYYTTATFPYILGCYTGEVDLTDARGDAGGDGGDAAGDRLERPQGEERPVRTEGDDAAPPERPEEEDRPERAERDETAPPESETAE